ncbi:MAG TPA: hypothetical protein VGG28_10185 [Kofleriaceae bacterium]
MRFVFAVLLAACTEAVPPLLDCDVGFLKTVVIPSDRPGCLPSNTYTNDCLVQTIGGSGQPSRIDVCEPEDLLPCWYAVAAPAGCPGTAAIVVRRIAPPPPDRITVAQCSLDLSVEQEELRCAALP